MDSVATLFRIDGAVFIGTHVGEILAISDDDFNLHYAVKANHKVKSIDLRNDGLLSVERELLGRLQQSSKTVKNPVELSVNIRFEKWDYLIEASFIHDVLLWTIWSVQRSRVM